MKTNLSNIEGEKNFIILFLHGFFVVVIKNLVLDPQKPKILEN